MKDVQIADMNTEVLSILALNSFSFLGFYVFHREIDRLVDAHIHIVQKKNKNVVLTHSLKLIRIGYFLALVGLAFFSYVILYQK